MHISYSIAELGLLALIPPLVVTIGQFLAEATGEAKRRDFIFECRWFYIKTLVYSIISVLVLYATALLDWHFVWQDHELEARWVHCFIVGFFAKDILDRLLAFGALSASGKYQLKLGGDSSVIKDFFKHKIDANLKSRRQRFLATWYATLLLEQVDAGVLVKHLALFPQIRKDPAFIGKLVDIANGSLDEAHENTLNTLLLTEESDEDRQFGEAAHAALLHQRKLDILAACFEVFRHRGEFDKLFSMFNRIDQ